MINWIKLDINILDDAKIKIIRSHPNGDSVVLLWLGILCLAMKSTRPGTIEISDGLPYTIDDLSNLFNIEKKTVEMGIALFCKYQMIEVYEGGVIDVINFSKHQSLEEIERRRELTRIRVAQYRKRLIPCNALLTRDSVTETPTDIDKDIDKDKKENRKFKYPSLEEIRAYCLERKNDIDPQYFIDYQEARDWKLKGGQKVKDWKAVIRTWEKNNFNDDKKINTTKPVNDWADCKECGKRTFIGDLNKKGVCLKCEEK